MQHDDGGMWYTLVSVIKDAGITFIRTENNLFSMHGYLKMQDVFLMTTKTYVRIAALHDCC